MTKPRFRIPKLNARGKAVAFTVGGVVGTFVGYLVAAIVVFFLVGFIVSTLWNFVMPLIFGLPTVNVFEGFAVILLSRLLLFGFVRRLKIEK